MSVSLSPYAGAGAQFFDNNGNPLAGGLIYTYAAGTTTPAATYTTYTGGTANANPIVLDSAGRTPAQIWLTEGSSYKFVLETSAGVTIKTDDNIFASFELAVAVGVPVGKGGSGVNENIAVGLTALDSNTTGSNNTAVGYNALTANTDGFQNTAVGSEALDANTSGDYNTAVGYQALTAANIANYNTGVGYRTLNAATTGANNTALGSDALLLVSTGSNNVAVGYSALDAYTGSDAVAVGALALGANTNGPGNTAVGRGAAQLVVTGAYNVAVGWAALDAATTSNNVAVGADALGALTSGDNNTAIGFQAGSSIVSGSGNIVIGHSAAASSSSVSNEMTLGSTNITSMRVPGLFMTVGQKWINNSTLTVAILLASAPAATVGAGARAVVTDASATTFHSIVAGGGANVVPVFSDGTDWRIG
jgi:hypothetical protein